MLNEDTSSEGVMSIVPRPFQRDALKAILPFSNCVLSMGCRLTYSPT